MNSLQPAHELLALLTEKYPPADGGRHSLVLHEDGFLLLCLRDGRGSWRLEGEDLKKPIGTLFIDICSLVDARQQRRDFSDEYPELHEMEEPTDG